MFNKRNLVKGLEKYSHDRYNNIKSILNIIDFHHVINLSFSCNEKPLQKCKFVHLKKLQNMIPGYSWDLAESSFHDPKKIISNFSSYKLTTADKLLLSKGLQFAIPPRQIEYSDFLSEFELLYRNTLDLELSSEVRNNFKTRLKDISLSSLKYYNDNCEFEKNLSTEEFKSLKNLVKQKDIVIQKADKGNTVVLTDRDKYNCGVQNVISDPNKFLLLNIGTDKYLNYIINVEKRFRKIFKSLLDTKEINDIEYDNICPTGSRPGILYGLPKIINLF